MDEVKLIKGRGKSLKVAVNEPINEPIEAVVDEPIEASKKPPLTKALKVDTRGKSEIAKANLEKGRAKLAETWAEKRRIKEELSAAALQKKINQQLKQKRLINAAYGVSEDEEEEEEVAPPPKKVVKAVAPAPAPAPKKKVIKYVEQESSSEEEEIVYVKKSKKAVVEAPPQRQIMFF
jgi:hypothetical protein